MSCVVWWWDVLFVKGMHFSSKNACLLKYSFTKLIEYSNHLIPIKKVSHESCKNTEFKLSINHADFERNTGFNKFILIHFKDDTEVRKGKGKSPGKGRPPCKGRKCLELLQGNVMKRNFYLTKFSFSE